MKQEKQKKYISNETSRDGILIHMCFFFLSFLLSLRSFLSCVLETQRRCYTYGWQHSVPQLIFTLSDFVFFSFFVYILLPLSTVFFFLLSVFFFPSKSLTVFVFLLLFFFWCASVQVRTLICSVDDAVL